MNKYRITALKELMAKLNYSFADYSILNNALTHSSYVNGENHSAVHNERMEFLGDAVLELCISEYLYHNHPGMNEGMMTRTRARTVCEAALCEAARGLSLGNYLLLSHGEENTGGRDKPSILSDALEAVIGAIFLDGGIERAREFVLSFSKTNIAAAISSISAKDYKTLLQEYVQHSNLGPLEYRVIAVSGPDHKRVFTINVFINERPYGIGDGGTKQEAGQNAAKETINMLKKEASE